LYYEGVYDTQPRYVCIDSERGALEAFKDRRAVEVEPPKSHMSD
jgi:hypothetical protein